MKTTVAAATYSLPKSLVLNRINMVNKLGSRDYYVDDTNALIKIEDKWWARPSRDHHGLRLYLLLSCFDMLGHQPGKEEDRYECLPDKLAVDPHTVTTKKNSLFPLDYTIVYQSINDVYALRNSFYYFINSILSPVHKQELMDTIIVQKIGKYTSVIEDYNATESEKLKFLFDIRNSYNFKGVKMASGNRVVGLDTLNNDITIEEDKNYHYSVQWNPGLIIKILEEVISKGN